VQLQEYRNRLLRINVPTSQAEIDRQHKEAEIASQLPETAYRITNSGFNRSIQRIFFSFCAL
jgi:hypothetical protein